MGSWKLERAYSQPRGTTTMAPVAMATMKVQAGMKRTPLAVIESRMAKEAMNKVRYHQRGTSEYERWRILSWSVYCSLISEAPVFRLAQSFRKLDLIWPNPKRAIHARADV
jgi:hypothetical protein